MTIMQRPAILLNFVLAHVQATGLTVTTYVQSSPPTQTAIVASSIAAAKEAKLTGDLRITDV